MLALFWGKTLETSNDPCEFLLGRKSQMTQSGFVLNTASYYTILWAHKPSFAL